MKYTSFRVNVTAEEAAEIMLSRHTLVLENMWPKHFVDGKPVVNLEGSVYEVVEASTLDGRVFTYEGNYLKIDCKKYPSSGGILGSLPTYVDKRDISGVREDGTYECVHFSPFTHKSTSHVCV